VPNAEKGVDLTTLSAHHVEMSRSSEDTVMSSLVKTPGLAEEYRNHQHLGITQLRI
jgi:hypothetical protein